MTRLLLYLLAALLALAGMFLLGWYFGSRAGVGV